MKLMSPTTASACLASALVILMAMVYAEYRSRNTEWRQYQKKGIDLKVEKLKRELVSEQSQDARNRIESQIASLLCKPLEPIEIKPFNGKYPTEYCMTCHFGIEDISASHPNEIFGCVLCHGGNGSDLTVRGSHLGLRGGRNPARLDQAAQSCGSPGTEAGKCHSDREHPLLNRVDNVPKSLMATNAGIIGILRFQWGLDEIGQSTYSIKKVSDGKVSLKEIPPEMLPEGDYSLADSHFRKFCAACHLWGARPDEKMGRLEGCPACHAPYAEGGRYSGCDPTIKRFEPGHAETHSITNKIPDDRCRACHNRSARVGLNYHGQMESEQYGTPFVNGTLNDQILSDERFITRLLPDIHHEKKMGCIDCHTAQDTMGDGAIHGRMKDQIEIRCEDCHGTYEKPPKTLIFDKYSPLASSLMRSSPYLKVQEGDEILVSSKGRPMPHIRKTEKGIFLTSKLSGKDHKVNVITGRKNGHQIKGHERLECDSCHSAWSPQCYGCHQLLDFSQKGLDHITGEMTAGLWAEGRTFFRFERNIYGINSNGRVGILVPGCQVWNTVIDSKGTVIEPYDSAIMQLKNKKTSIAIGPIHPHTTRKEVPRCVDCHLDPKALGIGDGRMKYNRGTKQIITEPIYNSRASGLAIDYPIDAVVNNDGKILQGSSHELSRGFNGPELQRIIAIGPCLACHDRYNDPVWSLPGPYEFKPPCREAMKAGSALYPNR